MLLESGELLENPVNIMRKRKLESLPPLTAVGGSLCHQDFLAGFWYVTKATLPICTLYCVAVVKRSPGHKMLWINSFSIEICRFGTISYAVLQRNWSWPPIVSIRTHENQGIAICDSLGYSGPLFSMDSSLIYQITIISGWNFFIPPPPPAYKRLNVAIVFENLVKHYILCILRTFAMLSSMGYGGK